MQRGTIMVYISKADEMFMLDKELPNGYLKSIDYSNTLFLSKGWFGQKIYKKEWCREAKETEREEYKKIKTYSVHSNMLEEELKKLKIKL